MLNQNTKSSDKMKDLDFLDNEPHGDETSSKMPLLQIYGNIKLYCNIFNLLSQLHLLLHHSCIHQSIFNMNFRKEHLLETIET